MKEKYEKSILTVTRFSDEDVITTSETETTHIRELSSNCSINCQREYRHSSPLLV